MLCHNGNGTLCYWLTAVQKQQPQTAFSPLPFKPRIGRGRNLPVSGATKRGHWSDCSLIGAGFSPHRGILYSAVDLSLTTISKSPNIRPRQGKMCQNPKLWTEGLASCLANDPGHLAAGPMPFWGTTSCRVQGSPCSLQPCRGRGSFENFDEFSLPRFQNCDILALQQRPVITDHGGILVPPLDTADIHSN